MAAGGLPDHPHLGRSPNQRRPLFWRPARYQIMITILLVIALALLLCAAFGIPSPVQLGWMGMAIWLLTDILTAHPGL